jgi:hypothetical protein
MVHFKAISSAMFGLKQVKYQFKCGLAVDVTSAIAVISKCLHLTGFCLPHALFNAVSYGISSYSENSEEKIGALEYAHHYRVLRELITRDLCQATKLGRFIHQSSDMFRYGWS